MKKGYVSIALMTAKNSVRSSGAGASEVPFFPDQLSLNLVWQDKKI
jgi:hypothetical protein